MKKTHILLTLLAVALVVGFLFVSCDTPTASKSSSGSSGSGNVKLEKYDGYYIVSLPDTASELDSERANYTLTVAGKSVYISTFATYNGRLMLAFAENSLTEPLDVGKSYAVTFKYTGTKSKAKDFSGNVKCEKGRQ